MARATLARVAVEPDVSPSVGGHDHSVDFPIDRARRRLVNAIVLVIGVVSVVGMVALWPRGGNDEIAPGTDQLPTANATVTRVLIGPCSGTKIEDAVDCFVISARISNGPLRAQSGDFEQPVGGNSPDINTGDRIRVAYDQTTDPPLIYFYDFQRTTPLILLALLFAAAVVLLGGWKGLGALSGLVVSLIVLIVFTLPSILDGHSPVAVALTSAAVIALLALYLAHGLTAHTGVAVLGTLAALAFTGLLAVVFVAATHLTGLTDENAVVLEALTGRISLTGIILAGIVIGSLGVLDDVTVTQVAAVGELLRRPTRPGGPPAVRRRPAHRARPHLLHRQHPRPRLRRRCSAPPAAVHPSPTPRHRHRHQRDRRRRDRPSPRRLHRPRRRRPHHHRPRRLDPRPTRADEPRPPKRYCVIATEPER